ncbi:MAG: hypothetical protein H6737_05865 [Alphaproteobacteria bacterium]|nr:hypothetical protein [Alphaproteobacteria bacterium]
MSHPEAPKAAAWTLPLVGSVAAVSVVAVLANPGLFMVDDAWFYLQIGRNIASGAGSTFDGTTPTNGYHPLWMGFVTSIAGLTGGGRDAMLYLTLVVQVALAAWTVALLPRIAAREGFAYPSFVATAVVLTQLTDKGWVSEGMLTSALHVTVLWSWVRGDRPWRTGVLLGLLFLARLDTLFFVVAVGLFTLPDVRRAAVLAAGTAITALPWLGWTFATTGHLVPVSGAIKSVFPVPDFSDPLEKLGWIGVATALGSLAGLVVALRATDPRKRRLLGALSLGAVAHALYVVLFTAPRWSTFVAYYWITGTLASGLLLGELLAMYFTLLPSLSATARPLFAGCIIGGLATAGSLKAVRSVLIATPDPTVRMALWLAEAHPDAVILTVDAPGRIAWFSGLPVIGADGLTQDYGFAADLEARGMPAVARERGVTHVLTYTIDFDVPWARIQAAPDGVNVRFVAPGRGTDAGELVLHTPEKRLTDFVPDGEDVAALFPMP